jgi:hypothetical protein
MPKKKEATPGFGEQSSGDPVINRRGWDLQIDPGSKPWRGLDPEGGDPVERERVQRDYPTRYVPPRAPPPRPKIQSFKEGGVVRKTGIYQLHAGERVVPAQRKRSASVTLPSRHRSSGRKR